MGNIFEDAYKKAKKTYDKAVSREERGRTQTYPAEIVDVLYQSVTGQSIPGKAKKQFNQQIDDMRRRLDPSYRLKAQLRRAQEALRMPPAVKYDIHQGFGTQATYQRMTYSQTIAKFDMTNADQQAVFEDAGRLALGRLKDEPRSFDVANLGPWAKAGIGSTQLLIELRAMAMMTTYNKNITRSDTTPGLPLKRNTMKALLAGLDEIRIPKLAYAIADVYTRPIQITGAERENSIAGCYFFPVIPSMDKDDIDDLVDLYIAEYEASVYAGYLNNPLVPINLGWIMKPRPLPFYSDYGQFMMSSMPVSVNDGGVTLYDTEFKAADPSFIKWNQVVGASELFEASALFRDLDGATDPYFIETLDPGADLASLKACAIDETTPIAVGKASTYFLWMANFAVYASSSITGPFGGTAPYQQQMAIDHDADTWDRMLSTWIANHIYKPSWKVRAMSLLFADLDTKLSKQGSKIKLQDARKYALASANRGGF